MMATERALTIYGALAKHSATQETKRDLTLHLRRLFEARDVPLGGILPPPGFTGRQDMWPLSCPHTSPRNFPLG
jgi:hypothetical protein